MQNSKLKCHCTELNERNSKICISMYLSATTDKIFVPQTQKSEFRKSRFKEWPLHTQHTENSILCGYYSVCMQNSGHETPAYDSGHVKLHKNPKKWKIMVSSYLWLGHHLNRNDQAKSYVSKLEVMVLAYLALQTSSSLPGSSGNVLSGTGTHVHVQCTDTL